MLELVVWVYGIPFIFKMSEKSVANQAKQTCKTCWGKGYVTYNDTKMEWSQKCACAK